MKNKVAVFIIICLMMMSSVFASTETISRVTFRFKPPYIDGARIEEKDIVVSEGVKIAGFTWVNKDTHVFMQSTEKY